MSGVFVALLTFSALAAGCGAGHLETGDDYWARGRWALALEYYEAGLAKKGGDAELKRRVLEADELYAWRVLQEADHVSAEGSRLLESVRVLQLEERARVRGADSQRVTELGRRRTIAVAAAIETLLADLDERLQRERVLPGDVRTCRQIEALAADADDPGEAEDVGRLCDSLLRGLKLVATAETSATFRSGGAQSLHALKAEVARHNLELLQLVQPGHEAANARLLLHVDAPEVVDTGWYESNRTEVHTMLPVLDDEGEPVKETVLVPPTEEEIKSAKFFHKPPPKPKEVEKTVHERVDGTVFEHQRARRVRVGAWLYLEDLRSKTIVAAFRTTASQESTTGYSKYRGHSRLREARKTALPVGRKNAAALAGVDELAATARARAVQTMARALVERMQ